MSEDLFDKAATTGGEEAGAYDVEAFLGHLDAMKVDGASPSDIDDYLTDAMTEAENDGDNAALLTILNEAMGVYRVQSKHRENQWIIQRAIELALKMGLEGTPQWAMTLVNAANAQRFAGNTDQSLDLFRQAIAAYEKAFGDDSHQTAELKNNYALLLTDLGRYAEAESALRDAISGLRAGHVGTAAGDGNAADDSRESDIATSLVNLAHVLMDEAVKASDTADVAVDGVDAGGDKPVIAEKLDEAEQAAGHARLSYERSGHTTSPHYAAALGAYARSRFMAGDFEAAADNYDKALAIVGACYGNDSDAYRDTHANFEAAVAALNAAGRTGLTPANVAEQDLDDEAMAASGSDLDDGATGIGDGTTADGPVAADFGNRSFSPDVAAEAAADADRPVPDTIDDVLTAPAADKPVVDESSIEFPSVEADHPSHMIDHEEALRFPDMLGQAAAAADDTSGSVADAASDTVADPTADSPATAEATEATDTAGAAEPAASVRPLTGLDLAERYWLEVVRPMLVRDYPEFVPRIAAGLVGHGSECYGFDDAISQDHDFGPGVCLWLTGDDYRAIGRSLQASYDALPTSFAGFDGRLETPRGGRRVGVFEIGDFYEQLTGYRTAPAADKPHEWLMLDEATLATATDGKVFADPLGAFSAVRNKFLQMPDDVRLSLISRRLGMMAQAGQSNFHRMLERGDGAAALACLDEFANATASLVFLINNPVTVGYLPYYKWRFAALRRLSDRMGMALADVCGKLETILALAGPACFPGPATVADGTATGAGTAGVTGAAAADKIEDLVESIALEVVAVLQANGLTVGDETFLEWQRPYVEDNIVDKAPCLHSI
ncbi:DUF4037 domain-containing protein [Bifidobacterium choloepi]|uniref:DUF4037 domain-containing protein n=1 Tax=Bifidobacterium choloepi TaxID=2614131 RepID=A0A6I5MYC4_9BIFI|nr:DUF4037 domain-containing protein [Bifidobacterium choloepi]